MSEATPQSSADEEQIGPLHFVANPDYPYPFKVETPPRFWMEETTGVLADAVETYMSGEPLTPDQLDLIKIYLRQFLERAILASDANRKLLVSRVDKLTSTADVEAFADDLSEFGAEVF